VVAERLQIRSHKEDGMRKMQSGFFRMATPALGGKVKWGTTNKTKSTGHTGSGDTNNGGDPICVLGICL